MPPDSTQPAGASPEVTRILRAAADGDSRAGAELLPLIYDELRKLAHARLRQAPAGLTLQTTALVHEAYLRLVGEHDPGWNGRHHFFGAAARAMRNILVDDARRKAALKHGGNRRRVDIEHAEVAADDAPEPLLALDDALARLEAHDARLAELVMLRYFAGLTQAEAATALAVSERTVERDWRYAKAWLRRELAAAGHEEAAPDGEP